MKIILFFRTRQLALNFPTVPSASVDLEKSQDNSVDMIDKRSQEWQDWYNSNNDTSAPPNKTMCDEMSTLCGIYKCHYEDLQIFQNMYPGIPKKLSQEFFGTPEKLKNILKYPEYADLIAYKLILPDMDWYKTIIPATLERVPFVHERFAESPKLLYSLSKYYFEYTMTNNIDKVEEAIVKEFTKKS